MVLCAHNAHLSEQGVGTGARKKGDPYCNSHHAGGKRKDFNKTARPPSLCLVGKKDYLKSGEMTLWIKCFHASMRPMPSNNLLLRRQRDDGVLLTS